MHKDPIHECTNTDTAMLGAQSAESKHFEKQNVKQMVVKHLGCNEIIIHKHVGFSFLQFN